MLTNTSHDPVDIVVLISGRGSNLQALLEHPGCHSVYRIAAVLSNRPDAGGLNHARQSGIPVEVVDHTRFATREAFDQALRERIDSYHPQLVVLAGFMRVLTDPFVNHYLGRMINIHPSLLPAFPGLHTHRKAIESGCKCHGATVHFVTPTLDHGPVISQGLVSVDTHDTPDTLAAKVLHVEHQLLPQAVIDICQQRLVIDGALVKRLSDAAGPALVLQSELLKSNTQ